MGLVKNVTQDIMPLIIFGAIGGLCAETIELFNNNICEFYTRNVTSKEMIETGILYGEIIAGIPLTYLKTTKGIRNWY